MAVDKSYGSGYKNTGMKKPVAPKAASAKLRKKGIKAAAKKYTSITTAKAKMLPGTSDYVTQENAARKQLGVAGLAARTRQLPTAARAFTKEMTGIDISRKGVSVDPFGLAMALPLGKVLKAAKAIRAVGRIEEAAALEARVLAKRAGQQTARFGGTAINDVSMRNQSTSVFPRIGSTKIRTAPNRILEEQGRRRYNEMDKFNDYMSGYPTSRAPKAPKTPKKNSIFGKLGPNILRPTKGGR